MKLFRQHKFCARKIELPQIIVGQRDITAFYCVLYLQRSIFQRQHFDWIRCKQFQIARRHIRSIFYGEALVGYKLKLMLQRFISLCHCFQRRCSECFSMVIAQTQTLHLGGQRRKERRFPHPEQRNFKYTLKAVLHTIPSINLIYQLPDLPDMCVQRLQIDIEKIGNRHTERLLFVPQALIRRFSIGAGCTQLYILRSILCIGCHPDFLIGCWVWFSGNHGITSSLIGLSAN